MVETTVWQRWTRDSEKMAASVWQHQLALARDSREHNVKCVAAASCISSVARYEVWQEVGQALQVCGSSKCEAAANV